MKASALREPHTKDGLAMGVGEGRLGIEWALFGELAMEEWGELEHGDTIGSGNVGLRGGGDVGTTCELSTGGTAENGAGVEVDGDIPEADTGAVFEQQPFLDGKQLVQRRFALAQTQFLHLPPPLQRQHCGILFPQLEYM